MVEGALLYGIRSAWRLPRAAVGLCPLLLPRLCGRNGAPSPSIPIGTMPMRRQSMSNPGSLMRERYMGREWDHRILTSVRSDVLQQRLRDISRQREELQQIEIELRAQTIARPEIMDMQNSYEAQLKEHTNASAKLEEQLQEREQYIQELELKVEEKDRELHAVNNEVHRVAQDAILLKDEQLREAHAWILRLQEMGALQSSSLQAELRERTDQFHQYYLGFQCQVMDMERNHLQAIQQLQSELAVAREQNGLLLFSSSYISTEVKHSPDMPVVQPSIVGVGQIPSHTHLNRFLPSNQVLPDAPQTLVENEHQTSKADQSNIESGAHYRYELPAEQREIHEDQLDTHINRRLTFGAMANESIVELQVFGQKRLSSFVTLGFQVHGTLGFDSPPQNNELEVVESIEKSCQMPPEPQENSSTNSQFYGPFEFDPPQQKNELKVHYETKPPIVHQIQPAFNPRKQLSAARIG
ncbi:hypothetical protein J5N97_025563 [Dioscorea zingiberensis]|uniref:Uncharacterized protein n=1 Tax=Dioscorea zingiberensis TaxID=325984 RepID=A0A9D5C8S5_9LILI|nr:hypothetical protein J5N97_025563 [Dioscorea zingiberensis]